MRNIHLNTDLINDEFYTNTPLKPIRHWQLISQGLASSSSQWFTNFVCITVNVTFIFWPRFHFITSVFIRATIICILIDWFASKSMIIFRWSITFWFITCLRNTELINLFSDWVKLPMTILDRLSYDGIASYGYLVRKNYFLYF